MEVLSPLEQAVLDAIALQVPEVADALTGQQVKVHITARKNRGSRFLHHTRRFTSFANQMKVTIAFERAVAGTRGDGVRCYVTLFRQLVRCAPCCSRVWPASRGWRYLELAIFDAF
jgi:hypothetical protein